jgi:hypothetical protein
MSPSFRILLTRVSQDSSKDDVIVVYVENYDSFRVHYNDKLSSRSYVHYYTWSELCEYLDSMRHLLSVDSDPYETIQLQVPGFPCISLKPRTFAKEDTYESFSAVVESYVNRVAVPLY